MKPLKPIISSKIYFPGLISILLLPLTCVIYIYYYHPTHGMNVSWFDEKGIERLNKRYAVPLDFVNFRSYTNLYLSGKQTHDKVQLMLLNKLADSLVSTNDQKNGVKIILTDKTKYQDMVTALDICMNHKSLDVIPFHDNIYLFKFDPPAISRSAIRMPPPLFIDDIMIERPSHQFLDDFKSFISSITSFWPCLIPFAGMIYFWRKSNKWNAV